MRSMIKKLFRTGFFNVFSSSVINKIISFFASVVLVRVLTKAEYGNFTYAWNIYSILILANGLGLESGVLQLCSENGNNRNIVYTIRRFSLKVGFIFDLLIAALLILSGLFVKFKIEGTGILLILLAFLPLFQFLFGINAAVFRAQKLNREYAYLNTLNSFLVFSFTCLGALFLKERGMILGYYSAYVISDIVSTKLIKCNGFYFENEFLGKEKKSLLTISVISMCNNGLSQLMYLLDVFVIGLIIADEEILASYKVATTIPSALTFIPSAMITYLYPYFAQNRNNRKWCVTYYCKSLAALAIINVFISSVFYIGAPQIIDRFYGSAYEDATFIFKLLSINYFISGTFRIFSGNLLITQRKLRFNLIIAIISGFLNVVLDALLISQYGSIGAAYATICVVIFTSITSTIYLIYTFNRIGKDG